MLRSIQTPHLRPIVTAGQITVAATPSGSLNIGAGDFSAISRVSAGRADLTRKIKPIRPGIVIGAAGADQAAGSYFTYKSDPTSSTIVTEVVLANGSAGDDGTYDFLSLDYDSTNTDRSSPIQTLLGSSNGMRWMVARIASTGVASVGATQFKSISKASSVYTLTFKNAFARTPLVFPIPIAATQKSVCVTAKSASACSIATFNSSEAAEDNAFYVLIVGWDRKDDTHGVKRAIQIPQRETRVEVFRVTGSGTAVIDLGTTDAALTDNGTGDYTLTWTKPFKREPIVIPSAKSGRVQLLANASTTSANIGTFNSTGSAADGIFSVLVIGFDTADEV